MFRSVPEIGPAPLDYIDNLWNSLSTQSTVFSTGHHFRGNNIQQNTGIY